MESTLCFTGGIFIVSGMPFLSSSLSFSLSIQFFSGREGECATEPEFCVSFVQELGVSNLVSLCKVTPPQYNVMI